MVTSEQSRWVVFMPFSKFYMLLEFPYQCLYARSLMSYFTFIVHDANSRYLTLQNMPLHMEVHKPYKIVWKLVVNLNWKIKKSFDEDT